MYHEHDECLYTIVLLQTDSLNKYSEIEIDTYILVYSVEACVLISLFYWNMHVKMFVYVYMVYLGLAWKQEKTRLVRVIVSIYAYYFLHCLIWYSCMP